MSIRVLKTGATPVMLSIMKRFWDKVDKTSYCWNWIASCVGNGYGGFRYLNSRMMVSHRVAWILTYGNIPEGKLVLHKCDNRKCVNPKHLFLGTSRDNVQDMILKNRQHITRGEEAKNHKLTNSQIIKIRAEYIANGHNLSELVKKYNVSKTTLWQVANYKRWNHVNA